jgi:putative spermidine/putrescine transport system ATP-binding protein
VTTNALEVTGLAKSFGGDRVLHGVDLDVPTGTITAVVGASGCGKTTLLRLVAGFETPDVGTISIAGRPVAGPDGFVAAHRRDVGYVAQDGALFPHLTVGQNIAYGLRGSARTSRARVAELLHTVSLDESFAQRRPHQLSGGQQQRVALARALAREPVLMLLDEPFSALDKGLRLDMQIEIKRLQRQFGLTAILVTHDQDEAMSVADRIAVMRGGRVEQLDTPVNVYDRPATLFVSGFIGTTNLLPGRVVEASGGHAVMELDAGARLVVATDRVPEVGTPVVLSARPEQLELHGKPGDGRWPVQRRLAVPLGPNTVHDLETRDGVTLKLVEPRLGVTPAADGDTWCGLRPDARPALFSRPSPM